MFGEPSTQTASGSRIGALGAGARALRSEQLRALVRRIGYGPNVAMFEEATALGYSDFVDQQLDPQALDRSQLESAIAGSLPSVAMNAPELIAFAGQMGGQLIVLRELQAATLLRALYSPAQLFEATVGFWSDVFSINQLQGPLTILKTLDDREVIRAHAFGRFRDLLGASARSPAMLIYLDNAVNGREGINENYARELMELHTLGVDGGYTEDDVVDVARCFSGWSLDPRNASFVFRAAWHDTGSKQVLGHSIAAGGGMDDAERVLDILATHPSTARNIATRMVRRFVSDAPEEGLVDAVAASFLASDGDIRSTLRTLLLHPLTRGTPTSKVKRPQEFVLSALRALGAQPDADGLRLVAQSLNGMAHLPFHWPAPNGYPDVAAYWVNANALLNRWNFALEGVAGEQAQRALRIPWNDIIEGVSDAGQVAQRMLTRLLIADLEPGAAEHWTAVATALVDGEPQSGDALRRAAMLLAAMMIASEAFQRR